MLAPDLSVRFVLHGHDGDGRWRPLSSLTPAGWLEELAGRGSISCCAMIGGFEITADGQVYNAEAIDEIRMAGTWLGALRALLAGAHVASVWAWEESSMTLVREGDEVELFDVHHSGHIVCPSLRLDLRAAAVAFAGAARAWMDFQRQTLSLCTGHRHERALRAELSEDWAADIAALAEPTLQPLRPQSQRDAPPPEIHRAVLLDDAERLARALAAAPTTVDAPFGDRDPDTPLHTAARYKRLALLEVLLRAGADVEARGRDGDTPLLAAVGRGDATLVARLLQAGASPAAENAWGWTALMYASRDSRGDALCAALLDAGARMDVVSAIHRGQFDQLAALARGPLHADALPVLITRAEHQVRCAKTERDKTAELARHVEALATLVERGADVNAPGRLYARLPLEIAACSELPALALALRRHGADPARAHGSMGTPREAAARYGDAAMQAALA